MKKSKFKISVGCYPKFIWVLLPTIEIDFYDNLINVLWLCFCITIEF